MPRLRPGPDVPCFKAPRSLIRLPSHWPSGGLIYNSPIIRQSPADPDYFLKVSMKSSKLALFFTSSVLLCTSPCVLSQELNADYARDPAQPIDQHYTEQMRKYTTDPA